MKPQQWALEAIAAIGARVLDGKMTRAEGDAAIAAVTREHPELGEDLAQAAMASMFAKWLREHTTSGDLFQALPFPGLPASLLTAPRRPTPVASMTGEQLDKAKNMLYARTQNAIDGAKEAAERERAVFDEFYHEVRPLLRADKTVADALAELALSKPR